MQSTIGKLLCTKELAERLGVSPRAAADLLLREEIRGFKLSGRYWRTTELYLELYVSRAVHEQAARNHQRMRSKIRAA